MEKEKKTKYLTNFPSYFCMKSILGEEKRAGTEHEIGFERERKHSRREFRNRLLALGGWWTMEERKAGRTYSFDLLLPIPNHSRDRKRGRCFDFL